jgi:protoporphyrinogen oxidase
MSGLRVVVLGAGPTGLGVAAGLRLCDWRAPVLVVERAMTPGGLAGSFSWRGHTVDHGPHRLSPNLEVVAALAEKLLGPDLLRCKSQHGVQIGKTCYQFPPRAVDWISPSSAWLMLSMVASFTAAHISWVTRRFQPDTFESMIVRKFGQRFYREIAAPMAEKVWTSPADIDPAFVDQRFSMLKPWEVIKRIALPSQELNPAVFLYPRFGFGQFWTALAGYVAAGGDEILYGSEPSRLEVKGDRVVSIEVRTPSGPRRLEGDDLYVVSTVPVQTLLPLLSGIDMAPLLESARRIRVRSMLLALFEFEQPETLPFRQILFPQRDVCFNRLTEQNAYSRDTVLAGRSVVVADVTVPREDPWMARPDEALLGQIRADMERLRFLRPGRVTASTVRRVEFAYPVPDLVSRRELHSIQRALMPIGNLSIIGRFGAGEYDNSDYALDNGITLAAMIAGRLSRSDYLQRLNAKRGRVIVG